MFVDTGRDLPAPKKNVALERARAEEQEFRRFMELTKFSGPSAETEKKMFLREFLEAERVAQVAAEERAADERTAFFSGHGSELAGENAFRDGGEGSWAKARKMAFGEDGEKKDVIPELDTLPEEMKSWWQKRVEKKARKKRARRLRSIERRREEKDKRAAQARRQAIAALISAHGGSAVVSVSSSPQKTHKRTKKAYKSPKSPTVARQ